jgi:hypothetical protein
MIIHPRSDNLKMALSYSEWEVIDSCLRTIAAVLVKKGRRDATRQMLLVTTDVSDILIELRREGHI